MNFIKVIISWLSPVFIVFKYANLILWKDKSFWGELAYMLGILGEAELILRIWGTKAKYSQVSENWVDQCIIVREHGSADPSSRGLTDHWVQQ